MCCLYRDCHLWCHNPQPSHSVLILSVKAEFAAEEAVGPEGILGELELGVKAGFKVVRTITVEGVETSIESKLHVATKYQG